MLLVGDIGNTETKICLVDLNKKIVKKINFSSKNISNLQLKKSFKKFKLKNSSLEKCLFCSVVPKTFLTVKKYIKNHYKTKCFELKSFKLYLWSFRDEGHFHEDLTNQIMADLRDVLNPIWLEVCGGFNVRGGIETTVTARCGEKPKDLD